MYPLIKMIPLRVWIKKYRLNIANPGKRELSRKLENEPA